MGAWTLASLFEVLHKSVLRCGQGTVRQAILYEARSCLKGVYPAVTFLFFKFLDAQRIHNLTKYLQALHRAQMATEEHTTLLLNCYTKLKDDSKINEFIMVSMNISW